MESLRREVTTLAATVQELSSLLAADRAESVFVWEGDSATGAKAVSNHFEALGWKAGWLLGSNYHGFRAYDTASGRDVQGKITPFPPSAGILTRFLRQKPQCRVSLTIIASEDERRSLESTIVQLLSDAKR